MERRVTSQIAYPYILLANTHDPKPVYLVNASYWNIGRGNDSVIKLADKSTSRNHAIIQFIKQEGFFLIDLGSRNGSFLNGRRVVSPVGLKNGDRITIGEAQLDFFCPDSIPPVSDTSPATATMTMHKRSMITVLVMDIRNFTGLTQQLDEQVLATLIGTWFRQAGEIISHYGSWVDKYIGDSIMSVWIHNTPPDQHKVDAEEMLKVFHTLYELYAMSDRLNQEFKLPFPLRVGAGVNTGYAMIGQMGTNAHHDYTALGDTVNAAFRLESTTKEIGMDIALGKSTYSYTPYASKLGFKQEIVKLKGYPTPVVAYAGTWSNLEQFLSKITSI